MQVETLVGGPLANNTYLVADETSDQALVVDPALGITRQVLGVVRRRGWTVVLIVATHAHWDHVADVAALAAATNAPLAAHRLDAPAITHPSGVAFLPSLPVQPAEVERPLDDGDTLAIGALRLVVWHTPGHTPGGICLYAGQESTLFTGDTLFANGHGRTDLPGGDDAALLTSLRRLAALPPTTRALPGHGPETTIGRERWLQTAPSGQ